MAFRSTKKGNHDDQSENVPATVSETGYAIDKMQPGAVKDLIRTNLGTEQLTQNDLNRVTVPAAGGTMWQVSTVEGDENVAELEGIIVHTQSVRAYWKESFEHSGGGSPPDCVSADALQGIGEPGGDCLTCPLSQFKSAKEGAGRGKACSESRLVYLLTENEILPLVVKVPATSLANARKYVIGLTSKLMDTHAVYTKLTLEQDKNQDGIKYSKIIFTKIGDVPNPQQTKAYAEDIKPFLTASVEQFASRQDPDPTS